MTDNLDTILIGIDLTPPSLEGAKWTAQAFAPDARLFLAHALDTRPILSFFAPSEAERKTEEATAEAGARLAELRSEYGAERVEVRLSEGSAGVELARLAEELNVDAISVGAHREASAGGLLGSVISTLLGHATVPVLIAHGFTDHPPRRILVAVDDSENAGQVLAWAGDLAKRFDATGHVVTAVVPPGIPVDQALFASEEEYERARKKVVLRRQRRLTRDMETEGLDRSRFTAEAGYGRAEEVIGAATAALKPELVVLGTRGFSHGQALMIGSVSRRIIESSSCPIFIVPPVSRE